MPTKEVYGLDGTVYVQDEDGQAWSPMHYATLECGNALVNGLIQGVASPPQAIQFSFNVSRHARILFFQRAVNMPNNWLKMHGYPKRRKVKGARKNEID